MTETISFRVPDGTKVKLKEKADRSNHPDLTSYLRGLVLYAEEADEVVVNAACAPSTHKLKLRDDQGCPLLRFVATERCNACPYREQPVVSRETPDPAPSSSDETSKMIDDLFKEDEGKT